MANLKPGPETALAFNRLIEAQGLLTAQNNTDAILKTIGSTDSRLATAVQRSIQLDLALRVTQSLAPSFLNKGVLDCDGLLAAVQGAVDTLSDFVFQTATIAGFGRASVDAAAPYFLCCFPMNELSGPPLNVLTPRPGGPPFFPINMLNVEESNIIHLGSGFQYGNPEGEGPSAYSRSDGNYELWWDTDQDFTISVTFRMLHEFADQILTIAAPPVDNPTWRVSIVAGTFNETGFTFYVNGPGIYGEGVNEPSLLFQSADDVIEIGKWYHAVIRRISGTCYVNLNGESLTPADSNVTRFGIPTIYELEPFGSDGPLPIMLYLGGGPGLWRSDVSIRNVLIWRTGLTDAAVADLWNEGAELVYSPDSTALPETPPTGWVEDPCLPEE